MKKSKLNLYSLFNDPLKKNIKWTHKKGTLQGHLGHLPAMLNMQSRKLFTWKSK